MTERLLLTGGLGGLDGNGQTRIGLGDQGVVDQLACGLDGNGAGHAHGNHGLAGEALGMDVLIGGDHDGASAGDLGGGELILNAHLAVRLDLDGEASLGRGLLERLLRHEGVGDARGAARGSDDVVLLCHIPSLILVHPFGAC